MRATQQVSIALNRAGWYPLALLLLFATQAWGATGTTTTLASSSTALSHGAGLALSATVAAGSTMVNPGTVTFCDTSFAICQDSAIVGRAQLNSSGVASIKFIPGIGTHTYAAVFAGTIAYTTSTSGSISVAVTGALPTSTSLASSGSPGNYTLTSNVTVTGNPTGPTGTVSFQDTSNSSYALGSATVSAFTATQAIVSTGSYNVVVTPKQNISADFNGDGIPDLAIASQGSSGVVVLIGNGDGTFNATAASPIATGTNPVGVVAADLNGDGKVDLVVTNFGSASISILLGNGDGTFQPAVTRTVNAQPESIVAADVNHDGNIDLIIAHASGMQSLCFLAMEQAPSPQRPASPQG